MNIIWPLVNLMALTQFVACRDFYLGMFRRNDLLVAQDVIYKAPSPFGYTTASYGRLFKCPITYFRVVDRLGKGRGPFTTIVRGGLRKKYISVRIKSAFRLPVSVNIYVGCENKKPTTPRTTTTTEHKSTKKPGKEENKREDKEKSTAATTVSSTDTTTVSSTDTTTVSSTVTTTVSSTETTTVSSTETTTVSSTETTTVNETETTLNGTDNSSLENNGTNKTVG